MDLSNDAATVNGRNSLFNDLSGKAVLPIENSFPTLKSSTFTPENNDELLGRSLDLAEEKREKAMIHMAYYHQKLKRGYDANVKL